MFRVQTIFMCMVYSNPHLTHKERVALVCTCLGMPSSPTAQHVTMVLCTAQRVMMVLNSAWTFGLSQT